MAVNECFRAVDEEAAHGGRLLGAPDYLSESRQLEIALAHVADLHRDVARLIRIGNANVAAVNAAMDAPSEPKPTRRERLKSAWRRRRSLGPLKYLRTVGWILAKSEQADTHVKLDRPLAELRSPLAGDAPLNDLLRKGRYDEAYVFARAIARDHQSNARFISLVRKIQTQRGAVSSVLSLTRRIAEIDKVSPMSLRILEGRLREISGWYPRIPGPYNHIVPASENLVLHLAKESRPYHSNGFTTRSHRNFLAAKGAGIETVVVTEPGFPRSAGVSEIVLHELVDGIEHRRLDFGLPMDKHVPFDTWLQEFAQAAYAVVKEVRPAVLHVSSGRRGYETMLVGLALKEKTGLPLVYEFRSFFESTWTSSTDYAERGETYLRRRAVEAMCIKAADVVITLGEAMRDELIEMGCAPGKIVIIPNGVDLEVFQPRPRSKSLAESFAIGDIPTFGYVSNMDHMRESQETLIRAAAELSARGREFRCVLVGDGPRRSELEATARNLGVQNKVVFTGAADHTQISEYYSLIDIFVVPRIDERAARLVTPLKPFEAMGMALPVVVSDLPALCEIVEPPARGLSFPVADHAGLADQIERLFDDPDLAKSLGRAGLDWVRETRQWDLNGSRYVEAFARARGMD